MRTAIAGLALAALAAFAAQAAAVDKIDKTAPTAPPSFMRVSTAEGLKVRNEAGENLGKIKDVVIDMQTGTVRYLALDFGGFLGIGDKLFAVPWNAFKYQHVGSDEYLMLNVTKEHLKNAPGFDKNHWPNMAEPSWSSDVDQFYVPKTAKTQTTTTTTTSRQEKD